MSLSHHARDLRVAVQSRQFANDKGSFSRLVELLAETPIHIVVHYAGEHDCGRAEVLSLEISIGHHVRRRRIVWREQLWFTSVLFAVLPLTNAVTTGRGLLVSLPLGDWVFAGFDLTALATSALFALAAVHHAKRDRATR